jgi:hypothetical protein
MFPGGKNCRSTKGALVLNLSEAKIPGVVRVDLSSLPFTHFHVRSGTEGSVLGYNDADGKFTALALFADRAVADRALHKVEAELLSSSPGASGPWIVRIGLGVVAAFLILAFIGWVVGLITGPSQQRMGSMDIPELRGSVIPGPREGGPPALPDGGGMPMDADSQFGVGDVRE